MSLETTTPSLHWNKVFANADGTIYQSDQESCWYVEFAGKMARFDYRNILKLKQAVFRLDIEQLLLNTGKGSDLEIIFICACDHCYVLTILQIISLRDLLDGTFVMLELNHIIEDRLKRVIV
jgi:hypothetical protein